MNGRRLNTTLALRLNHSMSSNTEVLYSDFHMNFRPHPLTGDLPRLTEADAVRQSLRNLILTSRYERPFDPRLGSLIKHSLFENMSAAQAETIRQAVLEVINNYEPRAIIHNVTVMPDINANRYDVTIVFQTINAEDATSVTVGLDRIR